MNWKTIVVLGLLVGGLLYLTQLQKGVEDRMERPYQGALLEDLRRDDIVEVRWDHIARNEQVALVREGRQWSLTDPIEYPAAPDRVKLILDGLFTQAVEIPEVDREALAKHFDPPRALITVIEQKEGGARRSVQVELGSLDVDGMRVEVRYNGKMMRILRNIDTALLSSVTDLRQKRLFKVNPARIVAIERSGFSTVDEGTRDLTFFARREGPTWQQYKPERLLLDPSALNTWVRVLSSLYVEAFVSDTEEPDLARYGLATPELSLSLIDGEGNRQTLLATEQEGAGWMAMMEGSHFIYALPDSVSMNLADDWSVLRDLRFLRAGRENIGHVDLQRAGQTVRLSQGQEIDADWTVQLRRPGTQQFGPSWPADKNKVYELLGFLEGQEIARWLPVNQEPVSKHFPAGSDVQRIQVSYRHALEGEVLSFRIGASFETEAGTSLLTMVRDTDEVVGLVSSEFGTWQEGGLGRWRSPLVWNLVEGRMKSLRLTQGDASRHYTRELQGTWRYADVDVSPVELLPALDHLIYLRAERYVDASQAPKLLDPIRIVFDATSGEKHVALLGVVEGGEIQIEVQGHRSVARNQDLHSLLATIVAP